MKLSVGMDAKRIVGNRTGLGNYGRTLAGALAKRSDIGLLLYAPSHGDADLRRQVGEDAESLFRYPPTYVLSAAGRAWWRSHGIIRDLKRDGVQVYHGLSGELPIGLRRAGIRGVVTIHDLIFLRHPEYYHWWDAWIYGLKFRQTLREAEHIIAISECTKRDIIELGGFPAERISVIYQSFAPRFSADVSQDEVRRVREKYDLPQRFILSVGTIEERKNLLLAARALAHLPEEVHLVAVGRQTDYAKGLTHFPRLRLMDYLPDKDLPAIYASAEAFVYPSRYEGFGIPIIEAISAGLPVVACTGSCLEEAGGPDCLYVDPDDEQGMAEALRQCLVGSAGREERIAASRRYIQRFESAEVAQQVVDIYKCLPY